MSRCNTCSSKHSCNKQDKDCQQFIPQKQIRNMIAIMSGKGGVGKSSCCVLLAKQLQQKGYRVGILDADITGPCIPRIMNQKDERAYVKDGKIQPIVSKEGIQLISINFLLDQEDAPALWRGPMITNILRQFYEDVAWSDLDYLLIDMPPGTGDVALTVLQMYPISGVVMVSTPQSMVSMIVAKAIHMCNQLNIPIIGVIENMCYLLCEECNHRMNLFDYESMKKFIHDYELRLLAELPLSTRISNVYDTSFNKEDEIIKQAIQQATSDIVSFITK